MTSLIGDTTMSALHQALSGLSLRQRTIADNVANIETPGFMAGKVDFETSLKRALRRTATRAPQRSARPAPWSRPGRTAATSTSTRRPSRASRRCSPRQLATAAMTSKFQRLRVAITGQA